MTLPPPPPPEAAADLPALPPEADAALPGMGPAPPRVPGTLRVASWNINSVRLRIDLVARATAEIQPDILCLQETKATAGDFPDRALAEMGWSHRAHVGMKGYNGVAILSRRPLFDIRPFDRCGRSDCRHVFALHDSGVGIHCVYVPAGGDIPDVQANAKYRHKLEFLEEMTEWSAANRPSSMILTGDLNVAPGEHDVWSHRQMLDVISHTPPETERMAAWIAAGGWQDTGRMLVPAEQKLYSWWSYRARDWAVSDRGRRLDHLWLSADLGPGLRAGGAVKAARGWGPKPSDHVPVWADLALA